MLKSLMDEIIKSSASNTRKTKAAFNTSLLLVFLLLISFSLHSCQTPEVVIKDIEVVDGDTLRIQGTTVRIIGIDTPETYSGSSKPVGEFGTDAKNFLYDFVSRFEIVIEPKGKDDYGRTLAYVFGKDNQGNKILYEASVTELGYARPLFYSENYVLGYGQ
ncbi:MAG: thermonuclease family protein, partial [Fervidobacterium sp.]